MGFPRAIAEAQRGAVRDRISSCRAEIAMVVDGLAESEPHHVAMRPAPFWELHRALVRARGALEEAERIASEPEMTYEEASEFTFGADRAASSDEGDEA